MVKVPDALENQPPPYAMGTGSRSYLLRTASCIRLIASFVWLCLDSVANPDRINSGLVGLA
eukprot:6471956-Prymnesium_polylepis.1